MTVASLPMYEPPELRNLTEEWWRGLAGHFRAEGLRGVPEALTRPGDGLHAHWGQVELIFSQGCGYPLTHDFHGRWQVIATPCYAAPGCQGPLYRSALVVRAEAPYRTLEDLRGRTACFNSRDSQSGYNVLRATAAPLAREGRFFGRAIESGGHIRSIAMVQDGTADVTSLDCVTYALYARHAPQRVEGTRILALTEPALPGLPYVTAAATSAETLAALRRGLDAALADPALAPVRDALLIAGAEVLPAQAYGVILDQEQEARSLGYPELG